MPCLFSVCYGVIVLCHTTSEVLPVLVLFVSWVALWILTTDQSTDCDCVVSTDSPNQLLLLVLTCYVCM